MFDAARPRCPVCRRPVAGLASWACPACAEKRRRALERPPHVPPLEGDERPLEPPLVDRSGAKSRPARVRRSPPGRRVFRRNEKGQG